MPLTGIGSLNTTFTDLSAGEYDTSAWDFGDGGTSALCNPPHAYTAPGVYTVTLTVSGLGGTDAETKASYIIVYTPAHADFSSSPTSGLPPLDATFTNLSDGDFTTCAWDFGDGGTSSLCSPTYSYTTPGVYTVTLTASGLGGTDTETKAGYITVEKYRTYLPLILRNSVSNVEDQVGKPSKPITQRLLPSSISLSQKAITDPLSANKQGVSLLTDKRLPPDHFVSFRGVIGKSCIPCQSSMDRCQTANSKCHAVTS
jgi:PKD repeat protein